MLTYESVKDNPTRLLALTSLTQAEFEGLLAGFAQAWQADCEQRASRPGRQRQPGGGRKAKLRTLADKLLFILVYMKTYPLQEVMGTMFGLSQGQVNVWIHRLTPLLQAALAAQDWLPERRPEAVAACLADAALWAFALDGTERRRQRPKDPAQQKAFYSGKKKPIRSRTW
jgi:hypothetical protein